MDTKTLIIAIVALLFFVLALVAIFRFDKVNNSVDVFGVKIKIAGSKNKGARRTGEASSGHIGQSAGMGKASVKIGGKVVRSAVTAKGGAESKIDVGKDVQDSDIHAGES